jgi:hypothetical protein
VADGWCWFVLREEYCCLVAGGWFVLGEKYCWLVADKRSEQGGHQLAYFVPKLVRPSPRARRFFLVYSFNIFLRYKLCAQLIFMEKIMHTT